MSYGVHLREPNGNVCQIERHSEGGTYVVGGTTDAHMNITWNYVEYFCEHIDKQQGIRWLYNKKAKDCIPRLEEAVKKLGTERNNDYWAPTAGIMQGMLCPSYYCGQKKTLKLFLVVIKKLGGEKTWKKKR